MATIHISTYAVATGKYLVAIANYVLGRLWWLFIVPFACFVTGIFDWRWAVVGLIILMLVYPAALTTALLTDALRPEIVRRAASRRAEFTDDGLITIFKESKINDNPDEITFEAVETAQIEQIIPGRSLAKIIIRECNKKEDSHPRPYDFILIPTSEIPSSLIF